MLISICKNYDEMSAEAAQVVKKVIHKKPDAVIGFATGSTPLGLYKELIRLHNEEGLSFSKITTFNLDEYVGLPANHDQSYNYFMNENLWQHIDISSSNIHVPDGMAEDLEQYCEWYEDQITKSGGIDLQILGIGSNGHIAFNEPGSSLGSRTRIKTLTEQTISDNRRFFNSEDEVPKFAITMGIGTIMDAGSLVLLANGESKAEAVRAMVEGPITAMKPATIVQMHRKAFIYMDEPAASKLESIGH